MPYQYSNGIGVPNIKVYVGSFLSYAPGTPIINFDLPYCTVHGAKEIWSEQSILHKTQSLDLSNPTSSLLKKSFGYYPKWTLDWNGMPLTVTDQINIASVYNNQNGNTVVFTPRKDYTGADGIFPVIITSADMALIRMSGKTPPGNLGVIMELTGRDMQILNIRSVPLPADPVYIFTRNEFQIS